MKNAIFIIFLLFGFTTGANFTEQNIGQTEDSIKDTSTKAYEISAKDSRGLRMDYDQWKPLGRGDPLQNDPTYDYVPPVLERVHYWVEPPTRKQDTTQENRKSEILVLGVSSKKPSTQTTSAENRRDSYESFLKFIDGPKYHQHNHNSFGRPNMGQRLPQSFHPQFYKNKFDDVHHKVEDPRVPYTVLVPPPIPPPHIEMPLFKLNSMPQQPSTTTTQGPVYTPITTTTSSPTVSLQEANLIYHSSSTAKRPEWQNNRNPYVTNPQWTTTTEKPLNNIEFQESETNINRVIFRESTSDKPTIPQSTKSKYKSSIVFPTETGKIVFEQHSTVMNPSNSLANTPSHTFLTQGPIQPISPSPTSGPPLQLFHATGPHSTVTQMSIGTHMYKGQVSDDTIGNTYVNIGKPNAHIQQDITDTPLPGPINIGLTTESTFTAQNNVATVGNKPYASTTYPHHFNSVYINRPIGNVPISAINNILTINNAQPFQRRPHPVRDFAMHTMQKMHPPPPQTTEIYRVVTKKPSGFLHSILHEEVSTTQQVMNVSFTPVTTTTPTPTTTVVTSLTTDPLFKHYKQPAEPLKGPMYLIIQGHSKVKTYGPTNKQALRDLTMTENNEIPKSDNYPVKHLHSLKDMLEANDEFEQLSKSRSKNARTLKELVNDGIGKYDMKETELGAGFEVSDGKTIIASEKYHKGIVETDETDMAELRKYHKGIVETDKTDMAELRKLQKIAKIREKRQIEDFLPVEEVEDTVETFVYDYLKKQSEGSGVGAIIASAITNDSSEDEGNNEISQDDDFDEDEDEDDDDDIL